MADKWLPPLLCPIPKDMLNWYTPHESKMEMYRR
jgi:hypothetical protein